MTQPHPERTYRHRKRGTYPLSVSAAQSIAGALLCSGPVRLMGWSLSSGSAASNAAEGSVVAPAAAATIVAIPAAGNLPAGRWRFEWTVSLQGPAAAADTDNFQLRVSGINLTSVNPGAAGNYDQETITEDTNGATNARIIAVGAGTAGVTYSAQLVVTPMGGQAQILDGAQVAAIAATDGGNTDTQVTSDDGIYIGSQLVVSIVDGALAGCVWVRDVLCDD